MNRVQKKRTKERVARERREGSERHASETRGEARSVISSIRSSADKVQAIREQLINLRNSGTYFPLFSEGGSLQSPDATYIRAIEAYRNGSSAKEDILRKIQMIVNILDRESLEYYATLFYYNELVGKRTDAQKEYLSNLETPTGRGGVREALEFSSSAYGANRIKGEYLAEEIRDMLLG